MVWPFPRILEVCAVTLLLGLGRDTTWHLCSVQIPLVTWDQPSHVVQVTKQWPALAAEDFLSLNVTQNKEPLTSPSNWMKAVFTFTEHALLKPKEF